MERRSASRRPASNRATSSIVALAVPLSIAPWCQESTWPENRTKRSSRWPWSSPTRWGMGLHPFCRRRERVGQPLDDGAVVETDPSIEGQAYVRLDLPALHLDAVRLERALDVVECLGLARAAGLALPRADRAHVLHERLRRHLGSQRRLERIAVFPGRGR